MGQVAFPQGSPLKYLTFVKEVCVLTFGPKPPASMAGKHTRELDTILTSELSLSMNASGHRH